MIFIVNEFEFDLLRLREEITIDILEIFREVDSVVKDAEEQKFDQFRPLVEGFGLAYDAVLRTLELPLTEENEIPIIESMDEIFDSFEEREINKKKAWKEIVAFMKTIIT